jgi:RNA polymerase sigma-70 factor (ECF subfamily)
MSSAGTLATVTPMTDAAQLPDLIDRAVHGDQAALERLMLAHYDELARRVEQRLPRSLQSVVGADDIVQSTYAQVFAKIDQYEHRDDGSFLAWLLAIAENRLRDAIRAQGRKKRGGDRVRVSTTPDDQQSGAANLFDALAGPGNTPSRSLARREGIRAVQVAVAGLPDEHRRAVELRYFEGYSLEETARLMDRSTGAVRGLLDRAKKKMRETLERASRFLSDK